MWGLIHPFTHPTFPMVNQRIAQSSWCNDFFSCWRMDLVCNQCAWRSTRRWYLWLVCRVWRNQKPPGKSWQTYWIYEGTPFTLKCCVLSLVYSTRFFVAFWKFSMQTDFFLWNNILLRMDNIMNMLQNLLVYTHKILYDYVKYCQYI